MEYHTSLFIVRCSPRALKPLPSRCSPDERLPLDMVFPTDIPLHTAHPPPEQYATSLPQFSPSISHVTHRYLASIEVDGHAPNAASQVVHPSGHDGHHITGEVGHAEFTEVGFEGDLGEVSLAVLDNGLA